MFSQCRQATIDRQPQSIVGVVLGATDDEPTGIVLGGSNEPPPPNELSWRVKPWTPCRHDALTHVDDRKVNLFHRPNPATLSFSFGCLNTKKRASERSRNGKQPHPKSHTH